MAKNEKNIKDAVIEQLAKSHSALYALPEIKRKTYSEWAAEIILDNFDKLKIPPAPPRETYDVGHTGDSSKDKGISTEKVIAKKLFNCNPNHLGTIGRIFDYEVPLEIPKSGKKKGDLRLGDIDLVSVTDNCIYLLEFKRPKSNESLLRCVLEIYTYHKQLPHKIFVESFIKTGKLKKELPLKPAILIFEDSVAYEQYKEKDKNKKALEIMEKAKVELFIIKETADRYEVSAPSLY